MTLSDVCIGILALIVVLMDPFMREKPAKKVFVTEEQPAPEEPQLEVIEVLAS